MTTLNPDGLSFARVLIASGAVDKTAPWSFEVADGDALLGGAGGTNWPNYAKHHLGIDGSAADKTKAHWKYPFAKGGKLYRSALTAIRQRAAQQSDNAIFGAAGDLLEKIDGPKAASSLIRFESKVTAFEFKLLDNETPGTFEGYGAAFGNEDDNGDLLKPGAFDKTLAQHKAAATMPKMLLNHGGMAWGSPTPEDMLPIGKWSAMSPDSHGLQCKGRLINLDTESGKRVYGAMKEGELSGLSMGYMARDFTRGTKPNEPRRTLNGVDLLEVSPVTFPANPLATVNEVKSAGHDLRILERALRDAGLSRTEAKAVLAEGFKAIALRDAAAGDDTAALLDALAARIRSLA